MGDPKKSKKSYKGPIHPWNKERIEEENALVKEYGLKNKTEVYKMRSFLKDAQRQVLNLTPKITTQAKKELDLVVERFKKLGLIGPDGTAGDILNLSVREIMDRRLQTMVMKKGLARSIKQARQFIIHRHIVVGDKKLTVPSYLVNLEEEQNLVFSDNSSLNDPEHPERKIEKVEKEEKKEEKENETEEEVVSEGDLEKIEKELEV